MHGSFCIVNEVNTTKYMCKSMGDFKSTKTLAVLTKLKLKFSPYLLAENRTIQKAALIIYVTIVITLILLCMCFKSKI